LVWGLGGLFEFALFARNSGLVLSLAFLLLGPASCILLRIEVLRIAPRMRRCHTVVLRSPARTDNLVLGIRPTYNFP